MEEFNLIEFLMSFGNGGWLLTIVAFIGSFRLIFKPIVSGIRVIVDATPTQTDNEFLDKVLSSKWYGLFQYLLDWFISIKLPKKTE